MFIDDTIIAGLLVVGASIVFVAGIAWFVYQDSHKKKTQ
jgi:hypothetical protein